MKTGNHRQNKDFKKKTMILVPAAVGAIAVAVLLSGCCTAGSHGSKCGGKTDTCKKCAAPPANTLKDAQTARTSTPALLTLMRGERRHCLMEAHTKQGGQRNPISIKGNLRPAAPRGPADNAMTSPRKRCWPKGSLPGHQSERALSWQTWKT
jgi:hypothetical protein